MGKVRVGFLEEVAPGLGLEGFAGRMTLGEDLLWRSMGGPMECGLGSGGGGEPIPVGKQGGSPPSEEGGDGAGLGSWPW